MTENHPLPYHMEDNFVMQKAPFTWKNLPQYLANAKKAIIQVTGLLASLLALGILHHPYDVWVATAVAVLTTISHYLVANALPPVEYVSTEGEAFPPEYAPQHAE